MIYKVALYRIPSWGGIERMYDKETPQHKNTGVYIKRNEVEHHINLLDTKLKTPPNLQSNEVFYFSNQSEIRLERTKEILDRNQTYSRTIFPDLATVIVLKQNIWKYPYGRYYIVKDMVLFQSKFPNQNFILNHDIVFIQSSYSDQFITKYNLEDAVVKEEIFLFNHHGYKNDVKIFENIIKCCNNVNAQFVSDKFINEELEQKQSLIIDEAIFNSLNEMFNSKDPNDKQMALNIIYKCNYKESLFWLSILDVNFGICNEEIDNVFTKWYKINRLVAAYSRDWNWVVNILYEKYINESDKTEWLYNWSQTKLLQSINSQIRAFKDNILNKTPNMFKSELNLDFTFQLLKKNP